MNLTGFQDQRLRPLGHPSGCDQLLSVILLHRDDENRGGFADRFPDVLRRPSGPPRLVPRASQRRTIGVVARRVGGAAATTPMARRRPASWLEEVHRDGGPRGLPPQEFFGWRMDRERAGEKTPRTARPEESQKLPGSGVVPARLGSGVSRLLGGGLGAASRCKVASGSGRAPPSHPRLVNGPEHAGSVPGSLFVAKRCLAPLPSRSSGRGSPDADAARGKEGERGKEKERERIIAGAGAGAEAGAGAGPGTETETDANADADAGGPLYSRRVCAYNTPPGRRGAGVVEQGCLLSSCPGQPGPRVRIPPSPPTTSPAAC